MEILTLFFSISINDKANPYKSVIENTDNLVKKLELIVIYRTLPPMTAENRFIPSAHGKFIKKYHAKDQV